MKNDFQKIDSLHYRNVAVIIENIERTLKGSESAENAITGFTAVRAQQATGSNPAAPTIFINFRPGSSDPFPLSRKPFSTFPPVSCQLRASYQRVKN